MVKVKIKAGFMLIEILLVLVLISFAGFKIFKLYFKSPILSNKETQEVIAESGIDTANYQSTVSSYKNKLEDIQKKHLDDLSKLEE